MPGSEVSFLVFRVATGADGPKPSFAAFLGILPGSSVKNRATEVQTSSHQDNSVTVGSMTLYITIGPQ